MIVAIIVLTFCLALGRMTPKIEPVSLFILLGLSLIVTLLTAGQSQIDVVGQYFINLAYHVVLYLIGHAIGRWLDRDKYEAFEEEADSAEQP